MPERRFQLPWSAEVTPNCFIVRDADGQQLAYVYYKSEPGVFTTASDPVRAGFVTSLSRPEGNATGITFMGVDLVAKRMELLHEILPSAKRIALLVNPNNPGLMQDNIQPQRPLYVVSA